MDMRIMAMEWGVDKESIGRVKEAILNYKVEREVTAVKEDPLLAIRNALTYGKLVIRRATTSYEFYTAFGSAPMPRDWLPIVAASGGTGCAPSNVSFEGKIVMASRGGCSFLDKAKNASKAGVLALVNNSSDLFQIATGYGSGMKGSGEEMPDGLPMVMVKRHALMALQLNRSTSVEGRLVPLRCPSGGACAPILPEESEIVLEVDSGHVMVRESRFEFLSATWGGVLPEGPLKVIPADPLDACCDLLNSHDLTKGAVVVTSRGNCGFGDKALAIQDAGAVAMIVIDRPGSALLRIGATQDQMSKLAIPGLAVSHVSGQILLREDVSCILEPAPGMAEKWLELGVAEWPEKEGQFELVMRQLEHRNADSPERLAWLQGKRLARRKLGDTKEL